VAQIFTTDFESADLAAWKTATGWTSTGAGVTIDGDQFHGGSKSLKIADTTGNQTYNVDSSFSKTEIYGGFWIYITIAPSAGYQEVFTQYCVSGQRFIVGLISTRKLVLYTNETLRKTTTAVIALNTWTYVSFRIKFAAASTVAEIKVSGETQTDTTSLTTGNTSTTIIGLQGNGGTGTFYIDDFILDDATYPPTGQFGYPISDVTDANWHGSGGDTDLYSKIDESTASDTDFIYSAQTPSNDECVVQMTSLTSPVAGTQTLKFRYRKTGSDQINLTVGLYVTNTLVQETTLSDISTAWADGTMTITNSISDYTALRLRFKANKP